MTSAKFSFLHKPRTDLVFFAWSFPIGKKITLYMKKVLDLAFVLKILKLVMIRTRRNLIDPSQPPPFIFDAIEMIDIAW